MDQPTGPPRPTLEQLRHVANRFPIIDSHAHNLILPTHADTIPFESITTEAQGRALRDTFKSLPHLRAARQLRQLYECGDDSDWEDLLEQRIEWLRSDPERFHRRCFEGIHALLIDEGLAEERKVYPYDSHDEYFQAPSKRIVRIETVAERLMERIVRNANEDDLGKAKFLPELWVEFTDKFEREIQKAVRDPEVACLKTVICYRTGLDIEPDYEEAAKAVGHPFERYVKACIRKRSYRIERKPLNDYLVLRTLEILSEELPHSDSLAKPLQFHTGLGDNDINLWEANPAYLQQVIESYPSVPFVLLHSAYPYTQEAAYLATVYRHVYLDIGEIFPMASRDGQRTALRQAMEIMPGSKLLYSSGGHWFPESFYLANIQFREVWLDILIEYVEKGDLTIFQAIAMTKDIMFNNSNTLYDLRYQAVFDETPQEAPRQLTYNTKPIAEPPFPSPGMPSIPPAGSTVHPATSGPVDPRSGSPYAPPTFPPPPTEPQVYDNQVLDSFLGQNPDVRFVYVQWLDYMVITHTRIVPIKEFTRMIREGDRIEISQENTGATHSNTQSSAGQMYIEPDLRSLRRTHNKDPLPAATVLSYLRSAFGTSLPSCPRTSLETIINTLQYTRATTLLLGFEIQVTFLSRNTDPRSMEERPFYPLLKPNSSNPPFLNDILLALDATGIEIVQCHALSNPGQYAFHLARLPPLLAIDTFLQARQTISQIASLHSLHATSHRSPFNDTPGKVAPISITLLPATHDMSFFVGGILAHLPALSAFSSSTNATDEYVAWGTRNHAVPLCRVAPGRWDLRVLDGTANVYLGIAATIAAGLLGLQAGEQDYEERDIGVDPTSLDDAGRREGGVRRRMPRDGRESVEALSSDGGLREILGDSVVREYVETKEAEDRSVEGMGKTEKRMWGVERF